MVCFTAIKPLTSADVPSKLQLRTTHQCGSLVMGIQVIGLPAQPALDVVSADQPLLCPHGKETFHSGMGSREGDHLQRRIHPLLKCLSVKLIALRKQNCPAVVSFTRVFWWRWRCRSKSFLPVFGTEVVTFRKVKETLVLNFKLPFLLRYSTAFSVTISYI